MQIDIREDEYELFRRFVEVYKDFKTLEDAEVFTMKSGHVIIHKDNDGTIRKVESMKVLYKL